MVRAARIRGERVDSAEMAALPPYAGQWSKTQHLQHSASKAACNVSHPTFTRAFESAKASQRTIRWPKQVGFASIDDQKQ